MIALFMLLFYYADTFLFRLEHFFLRFKKALNPVKTREVPFRFSFRPFCGRVISKEGILMFEEKKGQFLTSPCRCI